MIHLDINCDLAEGFSRGRQTEDLGIMKWITSVNVACGLHAGDPHNICRTVEAALRHGVLVSPGRIYYPSEPPGPRLRLTHTAAAGAADLEEGVRRLGAVLAQGAGGTEAAGTRGTGA